MEYKIEKNIPLQKASKYPFADMEPGDSFVVSSDGHKSSSGLQGSVHVTARRMGFWVKTRAEKDGFRVWMMGKLTD